VGPGWLALPAAERRAAAEQWLQGWRHAVPQGIVAVVDAASGRARVNFDAHGHARVEDAAGPTPRPTAGRRSETTDEHR
jgi:hypothetical protein